jgi:hypothetical protein
MFDPVRNPRKIKAVESDGQADLFDNTQITGSR